MTAAVLDIVESLTGYPRDLLDLDLDLEADLGVDTVKQAEVFAAVRERFAIPRLDSLKLRDFPTLAHVIGFAREHAPQAAQPRQAPAGRRQPAQPAEPSAAAGIPAAVRGHGHRAGGADEVTAAVLDIVESLTGYPRDLLDLDLDLEADLGVDTVKQAEVFAAVRERFAIPRLDSLKLRDFPTLTHVIGFAREHAPQAAQPAEPPRPQRREAAHDGRDSRQAAGHGGRDGRDERRRRSRPSWPSPATRPRHGGCRAACPYPCCGRPRRGASPPR